MTALTPQAPRLTLSDWGLLLGLSLLWGGSYFFSKIAVAELPPLTVMAGRVMLASLTLLAACRLVGIALPWHRWRDLLIMGALNNVAPFSLIFWAQTGIASGLASILNATTPLFTVLLAHAATEDERLTPAKLAGVLAGISGVAVLVGIEAMHGIGDAVLPELACLGAALLYATAGLFARKRLKGLSPVAGATGQVTASSLLALPIVALADRPWTLPMPGVTALAALAGLAVLSTALGYVVYFRLLARAGATNLLLVTFLIPASAILLGAAFLGERLEPHHLAGFALIGLGLAAIDGRLLPGRR